MRLRYTESGRSVGKPIKVEKAGDIILADLDEETISVNGRLLYVSMVVTTWGRAGTRDYRVRRWK